MLRKTSAYMSAIQALTQIQAIFYCDGQGLSYFEMECQIVNVSWRLGTSKQIIQVTDISN